MSNNVRREAAVVRSSRAHPAVNGNVHNNTQRPTCNAQDRGNRRQPTPARRISCPGLIRVLNAKPPPPRAKSSPPTVDNTWSCEHMISMAGLKRQTTLAVIQPNIQPVTEASSTVFSSRALVRCTSNPVVDDNIFAVDSKTDDPDSDVDSDTDAPVTNADVCAIAPVIGGKAEGSVRWFDNAKGFGFIGAKAGPSTPEQDYFVHFSSILGMQPGHATLNAYDDVEFTIIKDDKKKWKASDVRVVKYYNDAHPSVGNQGQARCPLANARRVRVVRSGISTDEDKNKICFDFLRGKCSRGERRCKYSHDKSKFPEHWQRE